LLYKYMLIVITGFCYIAQFLNKLYLVTFMLMPNLIKKNIPRLYIAAIGASAGGLEALQKLISHLPADIKNIAFIVVQHLSPNYKSMLVQSLGSQTKLKVVEVKNTVQVITGTIYITPPDREITIKKGKLYLAKSTSVHGPRPSIDALLHSLATDQKEKSIGSERKIYRRNSFRYRF
jgi:chemotaxis response regulator CheB